MIVGNDFGGAELDILQYEPSPEGDVDDAIESINFSKVEVEYIAGCFFTVIFHGASLLSFNKLLHLDHRTGELKRYRAACHNAAERAVSLAEQRSGCRRNALPGRLSVSLYRSGVKLFDNDELPAACKFLVDGFKAAGLLKERESSHILTFDNLMQRCGIDEPSSIGITFRRTYKS